MDDDMHLDNINIFKKTLNRWISGIIGIIIIVYKLSHASEKRTTVGQDKSLVVKRLTLQTATLK